MDYKFKIIKVQDKTIKLEIWDTAGQEKFRSITKSYYKGAHGVIITYDVTNAESFRKVSNWLEQISQNSQNIVRKILVGNKCDIEEGRVISYEEGLKLAKENNMQFFETSAKTNTNIDNVFLSLATEILDNYISFNKAYNKSLSEVSKKNGNKCCKWFNKNWN